VEEAETVLLVKTQAGYRGPVEEVIRQHISYTNFIGEIAPESINEDTIAQSLGTAGIPDPDLLIRTSGEVRLSNFLLWQVAYTEIYITETLWPDFREGEFLEALRQFQLRERRFGRIAESSPAPAPARGQAPLRVAH